MASILLVENDDQLRSMLKFLLTSSGHQVWETPNGTRVCDMHQEFNFDLVITDLVMPDTEGLGVITELRRRDQKVKIIAMSGGVEGRSEVYLRIAQRLGAQLTLSKPFANQQFLDTVSQALET
jgi:CheY-like chemotaxis protein